MTWQDRVLERHVQRLLESKLAEEGKKLWTSYVLTRDEFLSQVLKWISREEPGLTDHGQDHIEDVMDNAALLLGLSNEHSNDANLGCNHGYTPYEMFIMLCGLLLHDVGNIYGRNRHNEKIGQVWAKMANWQLWDENERQIVIRVGRAHSGKKNNGVPEDTIKSLDVHPSYFRKLPVKLAPIAAVIRFADELAEGPQRTSKFLVENQLIGENSDLYHQYAQIAHPAIDRRMGRIALTFTISLDNPAYPSSPDELKERIRKLLAMAYSRAAKLNYERQYARHYAEVLMPFRETSVCLQIYRDGQPAGPLMDPVVLTDFCTSSEDFKLVEKMNPDYSIEDLTNRIVEAK